MNATGRAISILGVAAVLAGPAAAEKSTTKSSGGLLTTPSLAG